MTSGSKKTTRTEFGQQKLANSKQYIDTCLKRNSLRYFTDIWYREFSNQTKKINRAATHDSVQMVQYS